jgi:4a-hydroxytetrahydrobiopterin dehydratase
MQNLADRKCTPCDGGIPPMTGEEISQFISELDNWKVIKEHHLQKGYKFKNYADALLFVNHVSRLAEEEGHHPDICFGWGRVEITLYTHAISGLSESDFILAAKIDRL